MPKVTYITFDGTPYTVEAAIGTNLMSAATDNGVPGIDGDCGGNCACATCHIYVEAPWSAKTGQRTQVENDMLNFSAGLRDASRLACQITMTAELDGLEVHMPEGQH
jgi:ferredoxin, 2Fe-2S